MDTIAVIDYGMGNLRSVSKALEHVAPQCRVLVTSDAQAIAQAQRVVFPGQGAMPDCMRELDSRGLRAAVLDAARRKPFLGICIGLQMLFEASEEGDVAGLGLFRGRVVRFPAAQMRDADGARLKVPHMGWNEVRQERAPPIWQSWPPRRATRCGLRVPWPAIISSPCNSTRRKARLPVLRCCAILLPGTVPCRPGLPAPAQPPAPAPDRIQPLFNEAKITMGFRPSRNHPPVCGSSSSAFTEPLC
jgi:imidazole glycerol phosphate synthase glutamine amidotransferase subunit